MKTKQTTSKYLGDGTWARRDAEGRWWTGATPDAADGLEWPERDVVEAVTDALVVCESADGWSLHAPGSTDEAIATGAAPALLTGEGEATSTEYERAARAYLTAEGGAP